MTKTNLQILIESETEERAKAALDVLKDKLVKRNVSLKHLDAKEPELSGKIYKINCTFSEGISTENGKKIAKLLKEEGAKSIKAQIQGDAVRVSSKSKDDLQEAMALIKNKGNPISLQRNTTVGHASVSIKRPNFGLKVFKKCPTDQHKS